MRRFSLVPVAQMALAKDYAQVVKVHAKTPVKDHVTEQTPMAITRGIAVVEKDVMVPVQVVARGVAIALAIQAVMAITITNFHIVRAILAA